jgi:hypothetical protein
MNIPLALFSFACGYWIGRRSALKKRRADTALDISPEDVFVEGAQAFSSGLNSRDSPPSDSNQGF